MTRVLIVDDHRLVRAGLAALLATTDDLEVVGEAGDGAHSVEVARAVTPDVVLMDISMPGTDGISGTRQLLASFPELRVVALTSFGDHARVAEMLGAGAVGYLLKDCQPDELLAAVRAAARGEVPIDARVAAALLPASDRGGPALSSRETQVLRLTARGLANKQIGRELGISERTVKAHLGNVFRQLGVGDRTSAAMWARANLPEE
jgi:DNA-binding NarL/FixJ family response regulator